MFGTIRSAAISVVGVVVVEIASRIAIPPIIRVASISRPQTAVLRYSLHLFYVKGLYTF